MTQLSDSQLESIKLHLSILRSGLTTSEERSIALSKALAKLLKYDEYECEWLRNPEDVMRELKDSIYFRVANLYDGIADDTHNAQRLAESIKELETHSDSQENK